MLNITLENVTDTVTLRCEGRLVESEETKLLCAAVRQPGQDVTLDLSDVTEIDAVGIAALLTLQAAGIYLRLRNASKVLRQALRAANVDSIFEFTQSEPLVCAAV